MARKKWRKLHDGLYMRHTGPGEIEGMLVEDTREADRAKKSLRNETDGRGVDHKTGMRLTASYPKSVQMQMHEELPESKRNPEARDWWLREKAPDNLIVRPNQIPGLRPRRTYFFMGRKGTR